MVITIDTVIVTFEILKYSIPRTCYIDKLHCAQSLLLLFVDEHVFFILLAATFDNYGEDFRFVVEVHVRGVTFCITDF